MSEPNRGCRNSAEKQESWVYSRRFLMILAWLALLAGSCARPDRSAPAPGVSWSLAQERSARVSDVSYDLRFHVPAGRDLPIRAAAKISFVLDGRLPTLSLDFKQPRRDVLLVKANRVPTEPLFENGHIVLSGGAIRPGRNEIEVDFIAGDSSLNRHDDYLYTLFVPDRASAAFPCFDQPDLKARYRLVLEIPREWEAVANAAGTFEQVTEGRKLIRFAETKPLSTYFFSFAAGLFQVEEGSWQDIPMRFLHRETDPARVARNLPSIFKLHGEALRWLEEYTGIPYPFGKFDFVAVPAFQFSGMEHPGAILYRDTKLFLDESATQSEVLERASLIAHETAHMWFGDLVTMRWFNDVWTKEVFANFMAAKIVNPAFPAIDHQLRFFLAHYPTAYDVDRTAGTHPIRQQLENMNLAATLYGPIIYQKAPIVMRQLEMLIGEDPLRAGLQEYLHSYAYGNAEWPDLIAILDKRTDWDLEVWSRNWVEESGRPWIKGRLAFQDGGIKSLEFVQTDPQGRGLIWPQAITPALGSAARQRYFQVNLREQAVSVDAAIGLTKPDFVLPDAAGIGYGRFELDAASRDYLAVHLPEIKAPVTRAAAWLMLYEALLEGQSEALPLARTALQSLRKENEEQNINFLVRSLQQLYWGFLSERERAGLAPELERSLWDLLSRARTPSLKASLFKGFSTIAMTPSGIRRLSEVWDRRVNIPGLTLSEQDEMRLAWELAVRRIEGYGEVLDQQRRRIGNPDRQKEFDFVRQAVGSDRERDDFYHSLKRIENRRHEPWVLEALTYLHHPLRSEEAVQYLRPSLEMLEEIQRTGDIFFPKGWLDATLSGHSSPNAAGIVKQFLAERPSYPPPLRSKLLQSADLLFRKSARQASKEASAAAIP